MITYTDYMARLIPDLPGCPQSIILQQLQQTMRDICLDTEAWMEESEAIDIVTGQVRYDLFPAFDYEVDIHRVLEVQVQESTIYPDRYKLIDQRYVELEDVPTANVTDGLVVKVVLVPTYTADRISPTFMNRYAKGIMAGCKSALQLQPKKPWSNPDLGIMNKKIYEDDVSRSVYEKYAQLENWEISIDLRRGIF